MGTHRWFPQGRPRNSAAAAVLALLAEGTPIVDSGLKELAGSMTLEELRELAVIIITTVADVAPAADGQ
jgi:hypothetical protein